MVRIGIGLPGQSVMDVQRTAEAAIQFEYDSFSVYGDLGDLPPHAVLNACAETFRDSSIRNIGPMGIPVGLQHPEIVAGNALALEEQLPGKTYVGLVRGAFLEAIGKAPAPLYELERSVYELRDRFDEKNVDIPLYIGGFGERVLHLAGKLAVNGIKLGGSTNPELATRAKVSLDNPNVAIVLGAVSVIDEDRKAARSLARFEVSKYLNVVGPLDPTLKDDDLESLQAFIKRFKNNDPCAGKSISDSLLDKFAIAGTPEDALALLKSMDGVVDRFEFGTPHGLGDRPSAIRYIGQTVLDTLKTDFPSEH